MAFASWLLGTCKNKTKVWSVIKRVLEMLHAVDSPGRFTMHISILKALRRHTVKKSVQLKTKFGSTQQDLYETGSRIENNTYTREFNTGNLT